MLHFSWLLNFLSWLSNFASISLTISSCSVKSLSFSRSCTWSSSLLSMTLVLSVSTCLMRDSKSWRYRRIGSAVSLESSSKSMDSPSSSRLPKDVEMSTSNLSGVSPQQTSYQILHDYLKASLLVIMHELEDDGFRGRL